LSVQITYVTSVRYWANLKNYTSIRPTTQHSRTFLKRGWYRPRIKS